MSDDLKKLTEQLRNIVSTYERKNPLRTADFHGEDCACYRCAIDACDAAVNALPELLAIKAERDRAQRACEQMGERITALESLVRVLLSDGGHTVLDLWRHDARAALNQEGGQ